MGRESLIGYITIYDDAGAPAGRVIIDRPTTSPTVHHLREVTTYDAVHGDLDRTAVWALRESPTLRGCGRLLRLP